MIKKKKQEEGRRKEKIKVWKNQTINPPIFFFFDEFGSKRTLLGILVVFDSFKLDLELFWFGLWLIWGCMETKYGFPKFLRRRKLS